MGSEAKTWAKFASTARGNAQLALILLADWADAYGLCWATNGTLGQAMCPDASPAVQRRTARRALQKLEAEGLIASVLVRKPPKAMAKGRPLFVLDEVGPCEFRQIVLRMGRPPEELAAIAASLRTGTLRGPAPAARRGRGPGDKLTPPQALDLGSNCPHPGVKLTPGSYRRVKGSRTGHEEGARARLCQIADRIRRGEIREARYASRSYACQAEPGTDTILLVGNEGQPDRQIRRDFELVGVEFFEGTET
jgi:hypothetical protein